jgi:hypothetical protein
VSRPKRVHEAFFDIHPLPAPPLRFSLLTASDGGSRVGTGAGGGAVRGRAVGPFPTSHSAYRNALLAKRFGARCCLARGRQLRLALEPVA